mmetsp:Transcript_15017/g.35803  ORF Transcript_15017/g.35803 Transcript_15017/m.35803 type:complete len:106 (-) Transcript_15017:1157-1474(-)
MLGIRHTPRLCPRGSSAAWTSSQAELKWHQNAIRIPRSTLHRQINSLADCSGLFAILPVEVRMVTTRGWRIPQVYAPYACGRGVVPTFLLTATAAYWERKMQQRN